MAVVCKRPQRPSAKHVCIKNMREKKTRDNKDHNTNTNFAKCEKETVAERERNETGSSVRKRHMGAVQREPNFESVLALHVASFLACL